MNREIVMVLALCGCVGGGEVETGRVEEALNPGFDQDCSSAEGDGYLQATALGNWLVETAEFQDCMLGRGSQGGLRSCPGDPSASASAGIAVARSDATATMPCGSNHGSEYAMSISDSSSQPPPPQLATWATYMQRLWHRAMHDAGYHDCSTDPQSMPYHAGNCMKATALEIAGRRLAAAGFAGGAGRDAREHLLEAAFTQDAIWSSDQLDYAVFALIWERTLRVLNDGLCVGVVGTDTPVVQQTCTSPNPSQRWVVLPFQGPRASDGRLLYVVMNLGSGRCLDRPWGDTSTHTSIQQYPCHAGAAQRWLRRETANGPQWEAVNLDGTTPAGTCLDIYDASSAPGIRLQLYACKDVDQGNQVMNLVF